MDDALAKHLDSQAVVELAPEQLTQLLEQARVLQHDEDAFNGPMRVLECDNRVLFLETTDKGTVVARKMASEESAMGFFKNRQAIHDRMWDGCGCKINYYK